MSFPTPLEFVVVAWIVGPVCLSVCLQYSLSINRKTKIIPSTKDQCLSEGLIWFLGRRQVHNLSLGTLKETEKFNTFESLNWFKSGCNIDDDFGTYVGQTQYTYKIWISKQQCMSLTLRCCCGCSFLRYCITKHLQTFQFPPKVEELFGFWTTS